MSSEVIKYEDVKPYAPAKGMLFHKVNVRIGDSTVMFVCSSFQTKEGMTTLYHVRQKKSYCSNESIIGSISFINDSRCERFIDRSYDSDCLSVHVDKKYISDFSVFGYEEIPCRSLSGDQIISIDSFPACDGNDRSWYTKDRIDAIEESSQMIKDHNDRVVDGNNSLFSKESLQRIYDNTKSILVKRARKRVEEIYKDEMKSYNSEVERIDSDWKNKWFFQKWFSKKEEYPTEPVMGEVMPYEFECRIMRQVKDRIKSYNLDIDLTVFNEIFGCEEDA